MPSLRLREAPSKQTPITFQPVPAFHDSLCATRIASLSHELRSPLTVIMGYAQTLLEGGTLCTGDARELVEVIASSAERLSLLIENVIDTVRMDGGAIRLEREPVRIERIVERVLAHRRPLTPGHELRMEADPCLPLADAEPLRVEQVIVNLVDNAIKYSPEGGTVVVCITAGEDIQVRVCDQGIGISPDGIDGLFRPFHRVETTASRGTRGAGLGLYISRRLVKAHGGRLWVDSISGVGSDFSFTLPILLD